RFLKRGFVPLLSVLAAAWVAFASGMFDSIAEQYGVRGTVESGRFLVWPMAIARWIGSPFAGVGASHAGTYVPAANMVITPHNSFIFIALVSGVIPLVFFVLYWLQATWGAIRAGAAHRQDAPFFLPLLAYGFLTTLLSG